jgi:TonB-dependent heme/hemoglobin receptor
MRLRFCKLIGLTSFCLLAAPAYGVVDTMDDVVVTASRIEESVFEAPQAVSTVSRKVIIERNYRTTPEALVYEPGVMVQKTAYGQGSPFIRGLTGKYVLILVDGVRLNNSTFRFGPNQYLSTIDPETIDRIEVVRGPGSVLYGSDAFGGVINIITRKRHDFEQASNHQGGVNLVYGSADNEHTIRADGEGNLDSFGYWLGGGYRDFDDLEGGGDIGTQPYTGYNEYFANATLTYQPEKQRRLDFISQFTSQNDVPRTDKFINSDESQVFDPQARGFLSLQWDDNYKSSLTDRLQASASYQLSHEALERQKFNSTTVKNYDDRVHTLSLLLQADKALGYRNLLTYGFEFYYDYVESTRVDTVNGVSAETRGNFPDGSEYYMGGLYLQDIYDISDTSTITAGIRYSAARAKATLQDFGELDETYNDVTASLRWSGQVREDVRIFAGIAQGFRAPNLDDLVVLKSTNEGEDVPSPDLDSEQSINYELGTKLNGSQWQGTLVGFYSDYTNLIDRRPGTYNGLDFIDDNGNGVQDPGEDNVVQKFNVGDAYTYGVEIDGNVLLGTDYSIFGNASWMYGQNETDDEPLSRIPPPRIVLGLRWEKPGSPWWLEPLAEYTGEQDRLSSRDESDPRIPEGCTPSYALLNVLGGWGGRNQRVDVAFNNITDEEYKVHGSGVYGPGREIKISYRLYF